MPRVNSVVVNCLAGQIEDYLERQRHVRRWSVGRQAEPRGTGDALMSCKGKIESDRVMVLSSRPGHIVHEAIVDLPKPRSRNVAYSASFIAQVDVLRKKIER